MIAITVTAARKRLKGSIDLAQREPVALTRRGHAVAVLVSPQDFLDLADLCRRRAEAVRWYSDPRDRVSAERRSSGRELTDADIDRLVRRLR